MAAGEKPGEQVTVCAGAVVRDAQSRVLLVRRANDPGAGLWSIPGGRVESGETAAAAAAREVREETGFQVRIGELLGTVSRGSLLIHDFAARVVAGEMCAGDDALECGWFSLAEMRAMPLVDQLLDAFADFGVV